MRLYSFCRQPLKSPQQPPLIAPLSLPRKPLAVAFDLDGTLVDSEALVREAYLAAASTLGLAMSGEQFRTLVGLHREANDAQLRALYGNDFPLEDFYTRARAHMGDRAAPLKPGACELLDLLSMALPTALVTSSGPVWVRRHFAAHNLTERFRVVITRGDCINGKPDPEPYVKAVTAMGVAPESTLALEDSYAGVRSAHAAGLMTVMVPHLLEPTEETRSKALLIATTLYDLIALF